MLSWDRYFGPVWRDKLRRLLPPVISSFLCFCFVVIKPLSNLGGEYAFLCYTGLLLFCFPGATIGAEIEAVGLGLLFVSCGLAWSVATLAVAAYCAGQYGTDSDQSRIVIGAGLGILAFVSGLIRSHAPRFALPSRIGLFFPVFLLTAEQGVTKATSRLFLEQFYVALFAGIFGLVPIALISNRSSGPALGASIVGTLSTMQELLPVSLAAFLNDSDSIRPDLADKSGPSIQTDHARLSKALRLNAAKIDPTLKAYVIEIVHGHLPPYSLQPIVTALKDLVRNPLLGSSSHIPGERIQAALARVGEQASRPPSFIGSRRNTSVPAQREGRSLYAERYAFPTSIPSYIRTDSISPPGSATQSSPPSSVGLKLAERWTELSTCICASLQSVIERIATTWAWSVPTSVQDTNHDDTRRNLVSALDHFETDLAHALDPDGGYGRALSGSRSPRRSPDWRASLAASAERDNFRLAFYMVSLLDLGRDTLTLCDTVERVVTRASGIKRWHIPHLPRWLRVSRFNQVDTMVEESMNDAMAQTQRDDEPSMPLNDPDFIQASLRREHHNKPPSATAKDRFKIQWRAVWDCHRVLRMRILLSRAIHSTRHSRNIMFASKLSVGIIILSIPALLPQGTAGRRWFLDFRGSWMVVSYLYVLDTHTGAIFRIGFFRIIGTFIGAVTAYVFTLIAHDNPYALVTLATLHSIPIAYIILYTTFPGVGTVAGITLPPLLFLNYLDLAMGHDPFFLAWTRFVDISIGIIAAVLVGVFVWPDHARVRYFSAVSITLERLTEYYLQLSRDNLRSTLVYQNDKRKYTSLDAAVRKEITAARTLVSVQRNEISLLPRPIRLYGEILDASERLIETMIEIRLLRFSVPRKETVLDVLPLRSELVSAILINLWACSQAFRSRSPLPQFLPSPRLALEELMITVDEHKRSIRQRTQSGISQRSTTPSTMIDGGARDEKGGKEQLAMLYAMAEGEALRELCDLIDELVAAAKTLFGSQTFLDTSVRLASPRLP